jgi:GntR family transcriptional repressor for pyruvate dehydrogenase complex
MRMQPIERSTLPDAIINQINGMIIDGNLKPGDKLPAERELASSLKVGRATVREALKALTSIGLLERSTEGTYIKQRIEFFKQPLTYNLILDRITLSELVEARKILEVKISELAAQRASEEELKKLAEAVATQQEHSKESDYLFYEADLNFHLTLAAAANNRVLSEAMLCIRHLLIKAQAEVGKLPGMTDKALVSHAALLGALIDKDAERAKKIMEDHINDVETGLRQLKLL